MPSESPHFIEEDFRQATILLVQAISTHSTNPWEKGAPPPEDIDAISRVLSCTLQAANQAISSGNAYDCFDIPKGNGKVRRIESPDGVGAYEKIGQGFLQNTESSLAQIHTVQEKGIQAGRYFGEHGEMYDEECEGVDDFRKLRHILAPREGEEVVNVVRQAQKAINFALSPTITMSESVCGFRYGSGAYDGLRRILKRFYTRGAERIEAVYQIDIRNFFPSITTEMATDALSRSLGRAISRKEKPTPEGIRKISSLIAHIASFEGRLPQGGHTSPFLSNVFAQAEIDRGIQLILKRHQFSKKTGVITMNYGRYADDIVILSDAPIPEDLRNKIDEVVRQNFEIAEEKRLYEEGKKQYDIWGATLLPDRYPEIGTRFTNFRFKLPKQLERRIATIVLQASEQISHIIMGTSDNDEGVEFLTRQALGYLSHAYNISRSGGVVAYGQYYLPQKLAHAWEKLRMTLSLYYGREVYKDAFRKRG